MRTSTPQAQTPAARAEAEAFHCETSLPFASVRYSLGFVRRLITPEGQDAAKRVQPCRLAMLACLLAMLIVGWQRSPAQEFALDGFCVAGGGGTSSGGDYSVTGTLGEWDAGMMMDGNWTLLGGFWAAYAGASEPQPELRMMRVGSDVVVSWPASAPGFTLQAAASLSAPVAWSAVTTSVVVVGGENTVTQPSIGGTRFYRLRKP